MSETFRFTPLQLKRLTSAFHAGATEASDAVQRWLSVPALISIDSVDQCPLDMATVILGQSDAPIGMCLMQMEGTLRGQMILAFDDASGLSLADLVLNQPQLTAETWGELETSAALESMNILGSAYLNGMSRHLSLGRETSVSLIPSPPLFLRDYAEALLQTAFMEQAIVGTHVLFARARFEIRGCPVNWTFLLIPDPESLEILSKLLSSQTSSGESCS